MFHTNPYSDSNFDNPETFLPNTRLSETLYQTFMEFLISPPTFSMPHVTQRSLLNINSVNFLYLSLYLISGAKWVITSRKSFKLTTRVRVKAVYMEASSTRRIVRQRSFSYFELLVALVKQSWIVTVHVHCRRQGTLVNSVDNHEVSGPSFESFFCDF